MRIKVVLHYLGLLTALIGLSMLLPLGWSLYYREPDSLAFLVSLGITMGFGFLIWKFTPAAPGKLSRREAIALVAGTWILASAFAALPYLLAGTFQSFLDAYFEAMSGFTTTGATLLGNIEGQPHGILLWRSFTQWLGGMGIIMLFVAFFPVLGMGSAYLVEAEMPGPQPERLSPRMRDTAKDLWLIYLGFSVLEAALLYAVGLPPFDALTVTFSTMSTGGFTPASASIGAYHSVLVEGIVMFFMMAAGVNFSLYYFLFWKRKLRGIWGNPELRLYLSLILGATLFISLYLMKDTGLSAEQAFRYGGFQTISIMTTTGFVTADFDAWPASCRGILLILMLVGACAGSTGGALKVIRILVLSKYTLRQIFLGFSPRAVIPLKVGRNVLSEEVLSGILSLAVLYFAILVGAFIVMSALGLDLVTAASSVIACLGNVGPGLGLVGPAQNYACIPSIGKGVLTFCMLVGRLEIFTVLALLSPSFWKWR